MIQLSTPIQTASPVQIGVNETEGNRVEGFSGDSPDHLGQIAEKENGPGIFAKLLESLTAKDKTAESGEAEITGDKLLPEAELKNTSHRLFTERLDLLIEQVIGPPLDKSIEQFVDLPTEQPNGLSIGQGLLSEAEIPLIPEDSESIKGEIRLMEALLARDHAAKQAGAKLAGAKEAGAKQVEDEGATKGRKLVHAGENTFPREMARDESPVDNKEDSAMPVLAEEAEEGRVLKAGANEDIAKLAAKKANVPSFTAASSGQTESEISQVKGDQVNLGPKPAGENGEGRKGSQTAESRKKGKDRINVEFLDLRTEGPMDTGNARGVSLSSQGQTPVKPELEISVDLNVKNANSEAGKADGETYQSRAFEDALARELRGNLSADIVRDATVIARNGGEGTIRLTLHPASMGNVKVRLEMAENKITGFIVMESDEALRAFERELPVLEKAFKDSGFSETNLELSLANDEGNFSGQEGKRERDFSTIASVMAASRYEADSDWVETGLIETLPSVNGETVLSAWPERIPVNLLI